MLPTTLTTTKMDVVIMIKKYTVDERGGDTLHKNTTFKLRRQSRIGENEEDSQPVNPYTEKNTHSV